MIGSAGTPRRARKFSSWWCTSRRPSHQAERRSGKGTPTSGQFSRWGPAQPAEGGRREGPPVPRWSLLGRDSGVQRHPDGCVVHAASLRCAQRRRPPPGETLMIASSCTPRRARKFSSWWCTSRRPSHQAERRAGKGTPTSGQFSRWGPAQPAAGGRQRRTPRSEVVPSRPGPRRSASSGRLRGTRRLAALRAAVPTGGRRSLPCVS